MNLDMASLFAARERERYALHARYLNDQLVRVAKTIGYDIGFVSGQGQYLFDRAGTRYLDLVGGWGAFALGRNHPVVRDALLSVLGADLPNLVQMDVSPLAGILAERLLRHVPWLDKAFFASSGAESAEAALKFARNATGRPGFVYCGDGFHGLTLGALSVNGDAAFRKGFGTLLADCVEVPFNDLPALEQALATFRHAAFIVEPIQGKGVHVPDRGYLRGAQELCRKFGTLLIVDEIQTGLGRTGPFVAVEHDESEPDMVLLSKGLSGGHVPVGAVLMRKWIFDRVFDRMDRVVVHGSTFSKNDLAMAAALATLDVIMGERLGHNAVRQGRRLLAAFERMARRYELIKEVRGRGLMIGLEFGPPHSRGLRASWHALEAATPGLFCQLITIPLLTEHNILSLVAGHGVHTVKIQPALTITDEDCDWIEQAFEAVIADAHRVPGAAWSLGKMLVDHAVRAHATA